MKNSVTLGDIIKAVESMSPTELRERMLARLRQKQAEGYQMAISNERVWRHPMAAVGRAED